MVKGATTIAQYKILNFIQRNFADGNVTMEHVGVNKVKIIE